jgi:hypothetical protein
MKFEKTLPTERQLIIEISEVCTCRAISQRLAAGPTERRGI